MRIKYFVLGVAASFIVLLIVGAIFAIKAHSDTSANDWVLNSTTSTSTVPAQAIAPVPVDPLAASPPVNPLATPAPVNPLAAQSPANPPATPAPVNPLAAAAVATPAAPLPPPGDVDPESIGYTVIASTDSGRIIFAQKTDSTTPQAAIIAALRDMARILDARPTVRGAFADSQQQRRGGATFTGVLHSQPIKGTIMCGIGDNGAAVTILYDRADAPASDWARLTAALPVDVQLQPQPIGDGAGTISIPPDWKIINASNIGSVFINGPNHQTVTLGAGMEVVTPDSTGAMVQNQLAAAGRLTPASRMLVAPFTEPADALRNLTPQLSEMSQGRGGPAFTLDAMLQSIDVAPQFPGGHAARLYYKSTEFQNGQNTPKRSWAQIECYPVGNGTWGIYWNSVSGPDATFDSDLPVMLAIAKSWKLNDAVVAEHGNENVAAQNARFNAFEQSQKEKEDAFDGYLQSVQHDELIRERSNADFDEVIRGYRTVYDTETGERGTADLGTVNEIVDGLNEGNPGRYVQIPLRDDEYPLTPANQ